MNLHGNKKVKISSKLSTDNLHIRPKGNVTFILHISIQKKYIHAKILK